MKNYYVKKMMLVIIPFIMITQIIIIPVMSTPKNNNFLKIKILDTVKGQVSEYEVSFETMKTVISLIMDQEKDNSFKNSVTNKLEILENLGLIESSTTHQINRLFSKIPNLENGKNSLPRSRAIFDLFNFFNGIFIGLKGEKEYGLLDLPVAKFPFINSNITALFSVFSQFSGNGSVFTLGTLGFKQLYDFDMAKYPFPHFPKIKGSFIGFTGIILELVAGDELGEEYEGSYLIAVGMTILTVWNNI